MFLIGAFFPPINSNVLKRKDDDDFIQILMSHQLCQNCRSNQFEHIDGRLYCLVCQSQNLSMQIHVSFANEGNEQLGRRVRDQTSINHDETIPKIEIFEANETILPYTTVQNDDETLARITELTVNDTEKYFWTTYEVYSYILNLQIQSIIQLKLISQEKQHDLIECTFMIYLRYLSSNGIINTNEQRLLHKQEERRLKTNHLYKDIYLNRTEYFSKTNTHINNKKLCILNLDILIGIIHCACTLINSPITIKQFIDLINNNQLPYYNIKSYLPLAMQVTGRDRFNLEKMTIHVGNLFFYYHDYLQPIIQTYLIKSLFHSFEYFNEIFMNICRNICQQIYFPFDSHTRIDFQLICQEIFQRKSLGRRFLSTSFHMELSALITIIIIILLRSIDDHLLERFLKKTSSKNFFSYSLWLNHLNQLNSLQSIRTYQFYGRNSILIDSYTDNQSKKRFRKYLSKIFDRTNTYSNEEIIEKEKQIKKDLIDNARDDALIYAFNTKEYFAREFPNISTNSHSDFFEILVNQYSPDDFSLIDKSELYETLMSLINGATINQVEHFYLIHQHFDYALATNFHFNQLLSTLTRFSSIPYDQEFYSFFSRFIKTFCFHRQIIHHYFYRSSCQYFDKSNLSKQFGMKQYGIDQLPIIYDMKFEQERPIRKNENV